MTDSPAEQHKQDAPSRVRCAVVTISDTRTEATDTGGREAVQQLEAAGHEVVQRHWTRDDPDAIAALLVRLRDDPRVEAVLATGGTGLSSRDHTVETAGRLITKPLPGYGELLRMLSFEQVGAAAMLSRAVGGLMGRTVLLTMPGSRAAVRLAMERLIVPELAHMVREARR